MDSPRLTRFTLGKHISCQFIQALEFEKMSDTAAGHPGGWDRKRLRLGNALPDRVTTTNYDAIPRSWVEYVGTRRYREVTPGFGTRPRPSGGWIGSLAVYSEFEFMLRLWRWERSRLFGIRAPLQQEKVNG